MKRAVVLLLAVATGCSKETLPELYVVDRFELVDQRGAAFGSEQLDGEVWIADFFFTSCPTICETLTRRMADLQGVLQERSVDARLVSFTVDPETDRPPVLSAYAQRHGADPSRWTFLTGDPEALKEVVVGSFKQPMDVQEDDGDEALMRIAHGIRFVLVDRAHTIRGLYETTPEAIEQLATDAERL